MNTDKKWYAVYTRPRWEKKVSELLSKRKVENYCPLNRVIHQWADRKKVVFQPLFTSYVFVYASEAEFLPVKQTDGVLNLVYWLGKPAVIKTEEIDAIKKFLNDYTDVKLEKITVNINDKVRITGGALTMLEGDVIEVKNSTLKVMLPSLGYAMIAEVRKTNVEIINMASHQHIA